MTTVRRPSARLPSARRPGAAAVLATVVLVVMALLGSVTLLVPASTRAAGGTGTVVVLRSSDGGFSYQPWAMGSDGSNPRQVTTQSAITEPALTPDGARLAFAGPIGNDDSLGRYAIYTVNIDGTALHQITVPQYGDLDPAWSADARSLLFTRNTTGRLSRDCCSVWTIGADGQGLRAIPGTGSGRQPAAVPGGGLVYVAPGGLYASGSDGSGRRQLVAGAFSDPVVSPDGRTVAVALERSPARSDLVVVDLGTGALREVAGSTGRIEAPAFDGNDGIYFIETGGQGYGGRTGSVLRRVDLTTGGIVTTTDPPTEIVGMTYAPASSPFGVLDLVQRSPGTVRVVGWAIDPKTSAAVQVDLVLDGATRTGGPAAGPRPDVARAYPGYGADHGFDLSTDLPAGDHQLCVIARSGRSDTADTTLGCGTAGAAPVGVLDPLVRRPGGVTVTGYALDPSTSDPVSVRITLDGTSVATIAADTPDPRVQRSYPGYADRHGYRVAVPLPAGPHSVCVQALAAATGSPTQIGCQLAAGTATAPFGVIDEVRAGPGGFIVRGWVLDLDTLAPVPVHAYVDGHYVTAFPADGVRPDIGRAYPGYGDSHGYDRLVPVAAGQHQLCLFAINDSGTNPLLGCRTVSRGSAPVGIVDSITAAPGGFTVRGWAVDPDTAAPVTVHAYVDGHYLTAFPADGARPDIARAFPGFGAGHGFATTVAVPAGQHQLCLFLINDSGINPLLSCQQVARGSAPFGHLDAVVPATGGFAVRGWALDPDTAAPVTVHAYLDGSYVTAFRAAAARPDVGRTYPGFGDDHGYSSVVPVPVGSHRLCLFGINDSGTNPLLDCRDVAR